MLGDLTFSQILQTTGQFPLPSEGWGNTGQLARCHALQGQREMCDYRQSLLSCPVASQAWVSPKQAAVSLLSSDLPTSHAHTQAASPGRQ